MTTVPFSSFLSDVLPYVRDCADPVAEGAVRSACIEFCQRSLWWDDRVTGLTAVNVSTYAIVPTDTTTQVVHVYDVRVAGKMLTAVNYELLNLVYQVSDWRDLDGDATAVRTLTVANQVELTPTPITANQVISMNVAVAPKRDATTVRSDIYNLYAEAIALGARSRLYQHVNAPYYDATQARLCGQQFRHEMGKAAIARRHTLARVPMVARPPPFV